MPAPMMKDTITLHVVQLDDNGQPLVNRNGVAIRRTITSKARVQQTSKTIFNSQGEEVSAVLEVDLPSDTIVYTGDIVEWVDHFGTKVRGPIAQLSEALSATGGRVYFRTALTE